MEIPNYSDKIFSEGYLKMDRLSLAIVVYELGAPLYLNEVNGKFSNKNISINDAFQGFIAS